MRILHLTDHYPPALGGIETHVAALAGRQAARGDDVTVLTSSPNRSDGRSCGDQGPVRVRRMSSVTRAARADVSDFDVVHAHMSVVAPFTSPVTAAIAKRGMPTVVTVHSLWRSIQPIPALAAGVYGLWNAPVVWSAVSRLAAEHVQQVLPSSPRVMVLPNAVQVSARARTPVRELDAPVELVSTMRIARRKRPLQLLDMFDRLQRSTSTDVRLTVVGDGPMRPRLAREIARRGLSRKITVTGRLEPQEVTVRLAEADVYVAPAVLESFGLAALEARCVGLPIVGRADSGMTDFISDGVEGSLSFSDAGMVDDLRDLVEDRPMLHRISEHNRTTDAGLTWERALAANDVAYDTAVAPTRLRRRRLVDDGAGG